MSYEIIYGTQFIKLERKNEPTQFIPMVLCGSNNCYETYYDRLGRHRQRRERSWSNVSFWNNGDGFSPQRHFFNTEEHMLKVIEGERAEKVGDENYTDSNWSYWSCVTLAGKRIMSFNEYKGIVKNGCKNALTIEELVEKGVSFSLSTGSDYYSKEQFQKAGFEPFSVYPYSTEEFFIMLERFLAKTKPHGIPCYFQLDLDEKRLKRLRKTLNPKRLERNIVEVDKWWSINIEKLGTFARSTSRAIHYSPYENGGKQFAEEKAAQQTVKRLQKRYGTRHGKIELVEHNTPARVLVKKYVNA